MSKGEAAVVESDNVDQIRDIIFGSQMRDYEKRFISLEKRVMSESDMLRSETSNRLDALESYIKQEVGSLTDQLSTERGEREDDVRHLTDTINKNALDSDKKTSQLQGHVNQGQAELRDSLLEQSKSLLNEIQNVRNTLMESLERSREELGDEKTSRRDLADMFNEVAMRLNGEFKVLDSESKGEK